MFFEQSITQCYAIHPSWSAMHSNKAAPPKKKKEVRNSIVHANKDDHRKRAPRKPGQMERKSYFIKTVYSTRVKKIKFYQIVLIHNGYCTIPFIFCVDKLDPII